MRKSKIVKQIIETIQKPGEDYTDGECLDEIIVFLEKAGYDFKWDEWRNLVDKNTGHRLLPISEYRGDK